MSDLNDLIATNAKVAFNQGVTRENERIVRVLRENLLPELVHLVTDNAQTEMTPSAHTEGETMETERKIMSRAQLHYIDGLADGFDRALKTVANFSNAIYDTKSIYKQDVREGYAEQKAELDIAMHTLEALRDQLETAADVDLDEAALMEKPDSLTDLTENQWTEIQTADDFKKSILELINDYKARGYVAVTLDKFAKLVIGGHAGFTFGEDDYEGDTL